MAEEETHEFESLQPPPYTISRSQNHPSRNSTLPTIPSADPAPLPLPQSVPQARYIYYRVFGLASVLESRQPFDHADPTIGRVARSQISPPRTAGIIKRYIAQLEGFSHSQVTGIYLDPDNSDDPVPDNKRIGTEEGAPGTSQDVPLAITVEESEGVLDVPESEGRSTHRQSTGSMSGYPTPVTPAQNGISQFQLSPIRLPSPHLGPEALPSPPASVAPSTTSADSGPPPTTHGRRDTASYGLHLNTNVDTPPSSNSGHGPSPVTGRRDTINSSASPQIPRWVINDDGFAEPTLSPLEADRVISKRQPPGWLAGRINMIGKGLFMAKAFSNKNGVTTLPSGTLVRNSMRIWVDVRLMKTLKVKTGDTFRTFRVILPDTREIVNIWTGDISIDREQHPPSAT